jgi:hypothetical protein
MTRESWRGNGGRRASLRIEPVRKEANPEQAGRTTPPGGLPESVSDKIERCSMIRTTAFIVSIIVSTVLRGAGDTAPPKPMPAPGSAAAPAAEATGERPKAGRVPAARTPAAPEGVTLEAPSRKLPEAERTAEGEMKALLAATATLKTQRALRYRTTVLPPGSYPVTIRSGGTDRSSLVLVVGPREGTAEDSPSADKPEEKKSQKRDGAEVPAGKRPAAKAAPGRFEVPFRLAASSKPAEGIEFSLRSAGRGSRVIVVVQAGASQGKATLRLADGQ